MTLSVIGAGFGRTGTESMKRALELLGLGPCHHMREVIENPDQKRIWRAIARGDKIDWDEAYAGYYSAVDWPSAYFWRQLSERYPQAKIVLTVRSPESWYASMQKTIFRVLATSTDRDSVGIRVIAEGVFGGRIDDREHAIATYEKNTAEVQAAFGPDRLLTCHLGDGWEPLCRFLGKPVPDQPFPRTNSAQEFSALMTEPNRGGQRGLRQR